MCSEPDARPKASEAKLHPFLTSLSPNWSFDQTALYRCITAHLPRLPFFRMLTIRHHSIMTQEEQRRKLPINSHSAQSATHA